VAFVQTLCSPVASEETHSGTEVRPVSGCVRTCLLVCLGLLVADWALMAAPARASGLLVPEGAGQADEARWHLDAVRVRAQVRGPIAEVTIGHVFRNVSTEALQAEFVFPLPPGAMVSKPTLRHGKRVLAGAVLRGAAARDAWTADLRRRKDPSLVRHLGSDVYRVRLPAIPAGARANLVLTFEQTLGADAGLAEFACPLQATPSFEIVVDLETTAPLGPVYSPTHAVRVRRSSPTRARIEYAGASSLDTPCLGLYWSTTRSRIGATLLTYWPKEEKQGYYLVLAAPSVLESARQARRAQSVTFVVDISGSMSGEKLEGMRAALQSVIGSLSQFDHFNVIAYHSQVAPLWAAPRPATEAARTEALGFVAGLRAAGHTNIEGALRTALTAPRPSSKPSVVVFLTDGRPTKGETDAEKILTSIRHVNEKTRTRIYVLGVGVDVNTVMLDRLALENGGAPAFVPPRGSVEQGLIGLFGRIRHPVLMDITLEARGMRPSENLAARLPDLFQGGELILAGRYTGGGPVELILSGRDGVLEREYHYARKAARRGEGLRSDFPARVWATRRIAALIDAIRLHDSRTPELVLELVRLSTEFGVLTEYTAFLAEEGCSSCSDVEGANSQRTRLNIDRLAPKVVGAAGLAQAKGQAERRAASRSSPRAGTWAATPDGRDVQRIEAQGVRVLGNRTYYFRGQDHGWVGATLDPGKAPEATIVRWSPAFFALLEKTTPAENARLAQPGRLLLSVQGRILRIVDPS